MISSNAELDAIAVANDAKQGERAANRAHQFLGRFVSYPSEEAHDAHTLWILHAHVMDRWDSTPRIAFLSPEPASGKSRALEVTALLVPNSVSSVNVTPAYLFRKIGSKDGLPTVLFDEIDTVFGLNAKDNEEIRGVLNAGHHRGATAGRCVVRGKTVETEELPAYCAVALAGLGWLPDTILTRSVIVRMRRRAPGEVIEPFRRRIHSQQAAPIYTAIVTWAQSVGEIEWPNLPSEIQDRDADVWESLVAVGDIIGGDWSERARKAAVTLVTARQDADPSLGVRLLADIKDVFAGDDHLSSRVLLEKLIGLEEAPWGDIRGKPLDERGLARRLKQYNVKPKPLWFGHKQSRGYERSDFTDPWSRYLPGNPAQASQASRIADNVAPFRRQAAPVVTDVTDVTHLQGHRCDVCGGGGQTSVCSDGGRQFYAHTDCVNLCLAEQPCR